jgi:cytochrome c-type biogenesis protein CcmH
MSAKGRPERELALQAAALGPLGGTARSARGALVSAKGYPRPPLRCALSRSRERAGVRVTARSARGALMKCLTLLFAFCMTLAAPFAAANDATPTEKDPVAASRAVRLSEQLRCLVCQNQTIAESNAELAVDLRRQVREQIAAGKTDAEIVDFMTARYGDFVLYRPPLKATTILLWAGPALLLLAGFVVLVRVLRSRRALAEEAPLTPAERERAARLLAGETKKEKK